MAYMLYRWEVILRESAIFGILGVRTLGYNVDAAISELRLDVAFFLLLAVAALSMPMHSHETCAFGSGLFQRVFPLTQACQPALAR